MLKFSNYKNILKSLFGLILIMLLVYIRLNHYSLWEILGVEDGIFEYIQFFLLLIAGTLLIKFYLELKGPSRKYSRILVVAVALVLFFVAFEEISWGQRILGFKTPSTLENINVQNETTIHNITFIHELIGYAYVVILLWAVSSTLLKVILNKFMAKIQFGEDFRAIVLNFAILPVHLLIFFLPIAVINFLSFEFFAPQDFEAKELLMYIGVFFHVLEAIKNSRISLPRI
jgi:hypothetical protein